MSFTTSDALYVPTSLKNSAMPKNVQDNVKINSGVYLKPHVVLVDRHDISSGEGIALGCERNPRCNVVGLEGTYGAFGMTGGAVKLGDENSPGLNFPNGASLAADKTTIQLDSKQVGELNAQGQPIYRGGVYPSTAGTVSRTAENLQKSGTFCMQKALGKTGPLPDFLLQEAEKVVQEMIKKQESIEVGSAVRSATTASALLVSLLALWGLYQ